jgi:predicted LPLAT superfamily acyltransferase
VRPCVIIPTFNHGQPLSRTLEAVSLFGLPIFVVDDGSDEADRLLVTSACDRFNANMISLSVNQGKGGAMIEGFRVAHAAGFSHAVQIDADGQHEADDIRKLLDAMTEAPTALIAGQPVFDASVPRSRLYGRRLTNTCVAIETLSTSMPDAMCGFRIYPIQACMELIESIALTRRMDFDIEILVRLAWRGVPIIGVPTRVKYFADGISNFRMLRDNWLITRLHILLFFGMLIRVPTILSGRQRIARLHWSRIGERGGAIGMRVIFAIYRLLGRKAFGTVLIPVMSYFYITAKGARKASSQYLRLVRARSLELHRPSAERKLTSFQHFLSFGDAVLDKGAMWANAFDGADIEFDDPAMYERIRSDARGVCFIGSHLGNLELLRAFGKTNQRMTVHALVYTQHSRHFIQMLSRVNPEATEHMIEVDTLGPESILTLREKIAKGEHVAIVGDRTSTKHAERSIFLPFLGEAAPFPEGPFVLAHLLACPVYLIFCLKRNDGYRIYLERFADPLRLPRKDRTRALHEAVSRYVERLEHYCLEEPLQWFNFFDFWREPESSQGFGKR